MLNLTSHSKIYLAGHQGLVGSALVRHFHGNGYENLLLEPEPN